ncbi:MAG: hypothetical protein AB7Q81_21050 [Gammaproteobacteria bacterium]
MHGYRYLRPWLVVALLAGVLGPVAAQDAADATTPAAPSTSVADAAAGLPTDPAAAGDATDAAPSVAAAAPPASPLETALLERCAAGHLGGGCEALEAAAAPFLVRFVDAREPPASGALLVIPGPAQVITAQPLLEALVDEFTPNGWAVLAVQLPLLAREATLEDYATTDAAGRERLDAALARLEAAGITDVVVLGLEGGAALVARALADGFGAGRVRAFASRGRWQAEFDPLPLPRLEMLAEPDPESLSLADARRRAVAASGVEAAALSLRYPGAGPRFVGFDAALARDLRGWIKVSAGS